MTINKKYDALIVDAVNFAYKTFKTKEETPIQISQKTVYRNSVSNFIRSIEDLKKKYLDSESGQIYILFDNYYSKADLKSAFMFADRKQLDEAYKANRTKENKSFYNSLNLIRYYYLLGPENYHTVRIDNLEADDLVKPLLESVCLNKKCLLVTNDLDWCRYLSIGVDYLPELNKDPKTAEDLSQELEFAVTECNLITYKALFGDKSDNIDGIVTLNKKNKEEFLELIKKITYPEELIYLSRDPELTKRYSILEALSSKDTVSKYKNATCENRYIINVQLVSSIPCTRDHVLSTMTSGRNSDTLYHTVRKAIGLEEISDSFTFGNVKRPRV